MRQFAVAVRLATICVVSDDDCACVRNKVMDISDGGTLRDLMEAGISIQEMTVERVLVFCPSSGEWIEDHDDCSTCGKPKET